MGVSLERAGEILALKFDKEETMKADGIIQKKKVDATQWGNRISLFIGNRWYSAFDTAFKDSHTKDLVHGLKEGDEVELDIVEKPNKNKPGEVFYNIVGAMRVDRVDKDGGKLPPVDKAAGQADERNRSVALSYAKDLVVAGTITLDQMYSQADYFLAYIKGQNDKYDYQGE